MLWAIGLRVLLAQAVDRHCFLILPHSGLMLMTPMRLGGVGVGDEPERRGEELQPDLYNHLCKAALRGCHTEIILKLQLSGRPVLTKGPVLTAR